MKKSNRYAKARKAMKAAWTNWKAGRYTSWGECLKSAWAWVKRISKDTINIYADEMYKITEKAVCVNNEWYPLSQVKLNWVEIAGSFEALESIDVPMWLYNKKNQY